ncbi:MAG: AI-2E family transporter [Azonexus sp.]
MFSEENPKRLAQIALVVLLIIGCIAVLLPMIGAVLFAFVIWICTWNTYSKKLLPRLGGRNNLGAALMTTLLILIMLIPMIFLAGSLASGTETMVDFARPYIERGLPKRAPNWLSGIPFFGGEIAAFWRRVATNHTEMSALLSKLIAPAQQVLLSVGSFAANGLLQLSLVLFVVFFMYRDGVSLSHALYVGAHKLGGELGEEMLDKARGTVLGVMLGLVGTAAAQGTVAMIGFLIAGVPQAPLLGFATFFLSMVPIGPPLIWGGAAAWLYGQDQIGWTIFMVIWGVVVVSSIDNFLKPILMARGAGISILLIALGVLGGILVFGFIGIFLGPVLLALGHMLFSRWTREEDAA